MVKMLKISWLMLFRIACFAIMIFVAYGFINSVVHLKKPDPKIDAEIYNDLKKESFPDNELKKEFEGIYRNFKWGKSGGGSGPGSSVEYTKLTRDAIYRVIESYNITSMIDSPCGAMEWMPLLLNNLTSRIPDFKYHGIDIVSSVIDSVRANYSGQNSWQFDLLDFTSQPLPPGYDLIYSRDALQHLPLLKVVDALENFAHNAKSRYLLVGSYLDRGVGDEKSKFNNKNIPPGGVFTINLTQAPFYLNEFLGNYKETFDGWQKYLVLYDIPGYLEKVDFDLMRQRIKQQYNF